jgi:uncharacterized protein involved in exopolysaccharide biosynthesis
MENNNLDLSKIKKILSKHRKLLILSFPLILFPMIIIAFVLPDVFRSSAIVLIENPRVPPNLVPSTVTSFADQRIQTMTQEATSRTRILNLVSKFDLLPEKRNKLTTEDLVERVRKRITMTPIDAEIKKATEIKPILLTIAFQLSYDDEDPKKSQKVTNELVSYYMEKNIEDRDKHAKTTSKFLQEQLQQAKETVSSLEAKLAVYREAHLEELPEFTTLNMQKLDKLNADITNLNMLVRSMEEQRSLLKGKVAFIDPLSSERVLTYDDRIQQAHMELAALTARYSAKHPLVEAKRHEIAELKSRGQDSHGSQKLREQLQNLELELADLKGKYTERHPAIQKKMLEIERVKGEISSQPANSKPTETPTERATNPAYISLKTDLEKLDVSISSSKGEKQRIEKQIEEVYGKLRTMPTVSKQYNELTTDYQNAKNQYTELQVKYSSAQVAQGMEEEQLGETFQVVEPPFLPEKPVKPNRLAIIVIGIVLAAGFSIGCVATAEFSDTSIRDAESLEQLIGMRVWSIVPRILTPADIARMRRKRIILITASVLGIAVGVAAFHFAVMDLYVLFAKIDRNVHRMF